MLTDVTFLIPPVVLGYIIERSMLQYFEKVVQLWQGMWAQVLSQYLSFDSLFCHITVWEQQRIGAYTRSIFFNPINRKKIILITNFLPSSVSSKFWLF